MVQLATFLPFPSTRGTKNPIQYTVLWPISLHPKRDLDPFSRLCRAQARRNIRVLHYVINHLSMQPYNACILNVHCTLTVGYLMLKNVSRLAKRLGSTPVRGLRMETPGRESSTSCGHWTLRCRRYQLLHNEQTSTQLQYHFCVKRFHEFCMISFEHFAVKAQRITSSGVGIVGTVMTALKRLHLLD